MYKITEEEYHNAKQIVALHKEQLKVIRLYEEQIVHDNYLKLLPVPKDDEILQYKDNMGYWYEYSENIQTITSYNPKHVRVIKKSLA